MTKTKTPPAAAPAAATPPRPRMGGTYEFRDGELHRIAGTGKAPVSTDQPKPTPKGE